MTTRTAVLQADLATVSDMVIGARTVVALPPSDLDPVGEVIDATTYDAVTVYDASTLYTVTYDSGLMRVYVNGFLIHRSYDAEVV